MTYFRKNIFLPKGLINTRAIQLSQGGQLALAINNVVEREYKSSSLLYFSDDFGKYKQTESYIHTYLENLFGYGNINITDLAGDFFKYNRLKFCYSDCTLSIHSPVTNWGLNIYFQSIDYFVEKNENYWELKPFESITNPYSKPERVIRIKDPYPDLEIFST